MPASAAALALHRYTSLSWLGVRSRPGNRGARVRHLAIAWARRRGIAVERVTTEADS